MKALTRSLSAVRFMLNAVTVLLPKSASAEERFWAKVDKNGPVPLHRPDLGPCWLWTAYTRWGYARFGVCGKIVAAHRWAYELLVAPIAPGLVLDHLCRVTRCVNPEHLEPVTHAENCRRGKGVGSGGSIARRAQAVGAASRKRRTMEETLPRVVEGVRALIAQGVTPTQRNCRSIPGYNSIQRYVPQADLVEMATCAP